jgi:uncharacterized protein DUF5317
VPVSLAVVVLVGAVAITVLAGGRWERLAALPLRARGLVAAAVAAQLGGAVLGIAGVADPRRTYVVALAVSAACALAFCARNLRVAGVALVSLGLVTNAVVVAANGAMPVSIEAAYHARVPIAAISSGSDARHEIAGIGTHLRWLGDVIPVPLPLRPEVISAGDVLVCAGLAELVALDMLGMGMLGSTYRKEPIHGEEGA